MRSRSFTVIILSLCSLFAVSLSKPTPVVKPRAVRVRQDPEVPQSTACGDIIDYVNDGFAYFYATDAYACLQSVPFHAAVATRFVDYVNTTIQFQSTLAYLKNPPTGYQQPAVDVLGDLQKIKSNITAGVYGNQYEFEADLQYLLYRAHDAHLYLTSGIFAAFNFLAPFSITAASPDGKSLPKVYVTEQILVGRNTSSTPSAIKTINGEDAVEYLKKLAKLNSLGGIEPHTDWNQLFNMPALAPNNDRSVWDGYVNFYPGDEIRLVLENGTEYLDYWQALYNEPYSTGPLTTGGDFYNYFVLGLLPASFNDTTYNAAYGSNGTDADNSTDTATQHSWRLLTDGAYPDPDVAQEGLAQLEDGVVSGYYLQDIDAAVLSLPSFGQSGYAIGNFSAAVSYFINNVTSLNISRVVIDLQQNKGGTVELAFSTFKRFFPDLVPFAGSRRRIHPLADALGETFTAYFDNLTTDDPRYLDYVAEEWVITPRLNAATGRNFSSWAEFRGPVQSNGESFSLTERYNLSSSDFDAALFGDWIPYGYTPEDPVEPGTTRPFDVDKIVILTDGICSSTCALMVEMFTQAGVKTIAAGGLPITGPMQAKGGTRGAASYSADALDQRLNLMSSLNATDAVLATLPPLTDNGQRDSGVFTTVLAINLRDQIRASEPTPLQFKYEAADCRIFYTLDNVYNMSRLWRDAATAAFDNPSMCVEGSTGYANSTKPAPKPVESTALVLNLDFDGADKSVVTDGLDMSGGLQGSNTVSRSNNFNPCSSGCSRGSQCQSILLSSCKNPGVKGFFDRCVPFTKSQMECPGDTTWSSQISRSLKGFSTPAKQGTLGGKSQQFVIGPCIPSSSDLRFCGS